MLEWGRTWDKNVDKLLSKIQKIDCTSGLGKTFGRIHLAETWHRPRIKRSCNGWHVFLYKPTTGGSITTSLKYFWGNAADESCGCQNVCDMKSHIYKYTPSSLTTGLSHAPQTKSNTRLLHDIISQTIKCSGAFSNNDFFYFQESPSPVMTSDE